MSDTEMERVAGLRLCCRLPGPSGVGKMSYKEAVREKKRVVGRQTQP